MCIIAPVKSLMLDNMNNEETILDPQYSNAKTQKSETTSVEQPKTEEKKNIGWSEKAAYAVGGAVVGAGMTMAGQEVAATSSEKAEIPERTEGEEALAAASTSTEEISTANETVEEVSGVTVEANGTAVHVTGDVKVEIENGNVHVSSVQTTEEQPFLVTDTQEHQAAPEPEDAIVATATGVRVAQVDDNASFSQAFADARAQVGPGGVFEWHGRVYGTYYKDEWDNMTAEQKHEYQASIDYKDVISDESMAQHLNDMAQHNATHHDSNVNHTSYNTQETIAKPETPNDSQDISSEDVDVQVLEVGRTDINGDGIPENAAVLEVNGHEVLIVDIDQDGIADAALCDVDNNGQVEIADLSGENMSMPEQSAGDAYMAQADNAPDYMNNANVGMYEA